ncbi:MAG: ATPase, T2SS/T4P/T4SS family [Bdellovibrionota bacterium]
MAIVVQVIGNANGKAETVGVARVFEQDQVSLGRAPSNDLVLSAPDVSGKHATLTLTRTNGKAVVSVTDLGSSNGTFLEDRKIQPNISVPVTGSQRIVIGTSFLLLVSASDGEQRSSTSERNKVVNPPEPQKAPTPPSRPAAVEATASHADDFYGQELRVKKLIHEQLIQRLDLRRKDIAALSEGELRSRTEAVVKQILIDIRWEIPEGLDREQLIKEVLDEALGLGPLEGLLADDGCSEIMVNNYHQIYAERKGRLELTEYRFSSEQAVLGAIERIIAPIGRRIDESSPMVDARLKDGSRVNAVIRPLALQGPCITIRKFAKDPLTSKDLVRFGSMSQGMADFLEMAVANRLNIVISGGTGSGKTTLLNVISSFIPEGRIITVEDAAELRLPQDHVVSFETRPPNLEGKGAITIRDLVRNALRMRPDRIIVGECRGAEALDMLQAMNTGHDGSMTTGHANSAADMIRRLETMVLTSGLDLPVRAIREQIASAVQLIVQQTRFACGTRKVTGITEVQGMDPDEGVVVLQDLFVFRQDGYDQNGKVRGTHQATGYIPKFFRKMQERGLAVNADVFAPGATD